MSITAWLPGHSTHKVKPEGSSLILLVYLIGNLVRDPSSCIEIMKQNVFLKLSHPGFLKSRSMYTTPSTYDKLFIVLQSVINGSNNFYQDKTYMEH